ncbi:MAG: formylglycine-generating enzyme family protein [Cyanobacteriota bacterium]
MNEEAKENKNSSNVKLLRGGSWYNIPRNCRSAYRSHGHPDGRNNFIGFRVCCLPQD